MSFKSGIVPIQTIQPINKPSQQWEACPSCGGKGVIDCHPAIGTCGRCWGRRKVPSKDPVYEFSIDNRGTSKRHAVG